MGKIPIIYSDHYYIDLGEHVFPTAKYRILREKIDRMAGIRDRIRVVDPVPAGRDEVMAVHTPEYIEKLEKGTLTEEEAFRMEIPYSPGLVEVSFISCGGTIAAARMAMREAVAVHLGGGFHHAFPDHGEGFCVLNDVAVAVRALQSDSTIKRALIVDCDVHQGNGTASIFHGEDSVFTFSIHQENIYPFNKQRSDLDLGLKDLTGDKEYLDLLKRHLPDLIGGLAPDIIVYLAGADPYREDQLGGLALSPRGLRTRDAYILELAKDAGVPVAVTLAGGYARDRADTVSLHMATIAECVRIHA
jgi:acetoin utilization deacetylase AcuC-like enzyme